ncbi:MAG: nuclear transport factor 2 family protein [Gemmatimonadota bacterium]|nr:nuclear transport factor 2 family protein [Gemmatimonadota bacterium]
MKRLMMLVTIASIGTAGSARAQAVSARDSASVTRDMQRTLDEMLQAANTHDTDRYMAAFARNPTIVSVFDGEIIEGWSNIAAQQRKWWNNGKSDVAYALSGAPRVVVLSPNAATVTVTLDSHGTRPNGQPGAVTIVSTMVWQRQPEGWRIVQAHESISRTATVR